MWRLNNILINLQWAKEEIPREIAKTKKRKNKQTNKTNKNNKEKNENEDKTYQNLWNATGTMLERNVYLLNK